MYQGSISGRSFTVMDGVRKLAAIEVNSSPPIGVGACHVPNVVPLGTIGQAPATPVGRTPQINPQGQQQPTQGGLLAAMPPTTPQLPRSHQAATGNVLPQPDVAVTSSTAQSVTATMTLARSVELSSPWFVASLADCVSNFIWENRRVKWDQAAEVPSQVAKA